MSEHWHPTFKGFARAAIASLRAHWRISLRQAVLKAIQTALFLATQLFRRRVPDELYRRREEACRRCQLYYDKLETCGVPGNKWFNYNTDKPEPRGCWCHLPTKSQFDVDCWLWEKSDGLAYGWPDELNASHYQL